MNNIKLLILIKALFLVAFTSEVASGAKTIYSDMQIPTDCQQSYAAGIEAYSEAKAPSVADPNVVYDREMAKVSAECQLYFSLGVFDAEAQTQQRVVLEYLLDMYYGNRTNAVSDEEQRANIKRLYETRFEDIGLEAELADKLMATDNWRKSIVPNFVKSMYDIATKERKAVPFGRFIFTNSPGSVPKSLYKYVWDKNGDPEVDSKGNVVLETGSYQKMVKQLFERTNKTVKEYLEWQPALFFGEDSHYWGIYGRMWHKWRTGEEVKSVREIKEEMYYNQIDFSIKMAGWLSLDKTPFYDAKRLMLKKGRAVSESEINAYTKTMYSLYAAPLVPLGMYIGAAGFVGAGLSALPAGTGSFVLASSSLYSAANVAAILAAAPMIAFAGIGTHSAVSEWRETGVFQLSRSLDKIIGATVQSFPLAAALPAIVGQGANGIVKAFVSAKSVIAGGFKFAKSLKAMGFKGSVSYLKKLPLPMIKKLGIAWWHSWKTNWKMFLTHQAVDSMASVFFECVGRYAIGDGCVVKGENGYEINEASKITLGTAFVGGMAGRPFIMINSLAGRMVAYRALYTASSIITQMLFNGTVDGKRIAFEVGYDGTVSSVIGEANRAVMLSSFIKSKSPATQLVLLTAWKILGGVPSSSARNHFLNRWVKNDNRPLDDLRELVKFTFNLDLNDIDDEALLESLQHYQTEVLDTEHE